MHFLLIVLDPVLKDHLKRVETLSCQEVALCQLAGTARVQGTVHVACLSGGLIVISAISITEQ